MIFRGEYVWKLNVDILVLDELALHQIDMIGWAIRTAALNLELPQVIATLNTNSNKIEVGLVEEIYTDKDNTDQLIKVKSAQKAPFIISVALMRDSEQDIVVLDVDQTEIQCVDQILHMAVGKDLQIGGFIQSKGMNSKKQPCGLPAAIFSSKNVKAILSDKVRQLSRL